MIEQGKKLDEIFEDYRAEVEQVDDVVVIGVRYQNEKKGQLNLEMPPDTIMLFF